MNRIAALTSAFALLALPSIARADDIPNLPITVDGGYLHSSDGQSAGAAVITLQGVGVHVPVLSPQVSFMAPLTSGGGRYALTTEAALHLPGTRITAGVGAGVGRLDTPLQTGVLADAFVTAGIAPHIGATVRYYSALNHYSGQALFAGVAVHL
jgi:hypothetical protein